MALKKSELYSSLWQSCDELRGEMNASQYKDYVFTLLFMKYVSERRRDKIRAIKQGTMQQFLTGRVRLVERGELADV